MNVFDLNSSGSASRRIAELAANKHFVTQSVAPTRRAWPFSVNVTRPSVKPAWLTCTGELSTWSQAHISSDPTGQPCSFVS